MLPVRLPVRCYWLVGTLLVALSTVTVSPAHAENALDRIKHRGTLIWGADQAGGAPFVFTENGKLVGFEVELAEMLAAELGVKAEFKQGDWDKLPLMLGNSIDVALNGFELTSVRQRDFLCTRPYYMYALQFMARRDSPIMSVEEIRTPQEGRVLSGGALAGSAAETYLKSLKESNVVTTGFEGNAEAMEKVRDGNLDITLQDDCIALYLADRFPQLKFVGKPVGEGYYVALVEKNEPGLQAALNEALAKIIQDGRLEALYDRWDMSGKAQMMALRHTNEVVAAERQTFSEIVSENLPTLLRAAGMTVFLSVVSMPLAIGIGILVAIGRLYGPRWVGIPLGWYVEVIRGTPLMLQLYAIFFLLPKLLISLGLDWDVPALVAAITGLALNYSAYEAEIYRAGLQAIPRGQMEAALALGMSRPRAIWRILLPQAFRIVIPPVTNDFIALFKDTSVCSVVTVVELTKQYSISALSTGAIVELAAMTAVLYMLMSYPLSLFARWSERHLAGKATIH
ncbi:MAG: ABC transporter substrate-binding protein/permease [Planctomycetota bacterium]|nr:ABC transporter substrate-binding protein/permease [Planctomycetota bacterium]